MTDQEIAAVVRATYEDGVTVAEMADRVIFGQALLRAQAALAARPVGKSVSEWQPIETAPKDGTAILVCWAFNSEGPIRWEEDPATAGVFVQVASWCGAEEWVVYCSMVQDPRLHFNPTHWMALPDAPTVKGEIS